MVDIPFECNDKMFKGICEDLGELDPDEFNRRLNIWLNNAVVYYLSRDNDSHILCLECQSILELTGFDTQKTNNKVFAKRYFKCSGCGKETTIDFDMTKCYVDIINSE